MTGFFAGIALIWGVLVAVLAVLVGWLLAAAVYRDATLLERDGSRTTILVAPWVWAVITFIGGVVPAVAYWLIHHGIVAGETRVMVGGYVLDNGPGSTAKGQDQ